jgi:hypothetical protein
VGDRHTRVRRSSCALHARSDRRHNQYSGLEIQPVVAVPSYTTSNVRLAWQATDQLVLSVMGQNLHDEHHPEWPGDDGANVEIERRFQAGLTWRQ